MSMSVEWAGRWRYVSGASYGERIVLCRMVESRGVCPNANYRLHPGDGAWGPGDRICQAKVSGSGSHAETGHNQPTLQLPIPDAWYLTPWYGELSCEPAVVRTGSSVFCDLWPYVLSEELYIEYIRNFCKPKYYEEMRPHDRSLVRASNSTTLLDHGGRHLRFFAAR